MLAVLLLLALYLLFLVCNFKKKVSFCISWLKDGLWQVALRRDITFPTRGSAVKTFNTVLLRTVIAAHLVYSDSCA